MPPVASKFGHHNDFSANGPASFLKTIITGMIQSSADLATFMRKTLLYHQSPDTCLTVADSALKFLQDSSFAQRVEGTRLSDCLFEAVEIYKISPPFSFSLPLFTGTLMSIDLSLVLLPGKIETTPFGKAVYKSSLNPTISHKVMQGIREANRHLVLLGDLHLVYLCVPPILELVFFVFTV